MKVHQILRSKGTAVITTHPDVTLHDALRILVSNRVGTLVVTTIEGKVVGIITERDLLRGGGRLTVARSTTPGSLCV